MAFSTRYGNARSIRGQDGTDGVDGEPGPQGRQGIPGVNAVPAAEAVAAYITDPDPDPTTNPVPAALDTKIEATTTDTDGVVVEFNDGRYAPVSVLASQSSYPMPQPPLSFITTFQAGHGFTSSGSGTFDLNHTAADAPIGTQYVRVTTPGNGASGYVTKQGFPAADFSAGKRIAILCRVDQPAHLNLLSVRLYTDASNSRLLSINPTHSNLRSVTMPGEWSWIYATLADNANVDAGAFNAASVTGYRVGIQDNNDAVPINADVAAIAIFDPEPIADKAIITFTFDDGFLAHRTIAAPSLGLHGWTATAFPLGEYTDTGGANYMTKDQLRDLQNVYRWEFGGHAYSAAMHNNSPGYPNYTLDQVSADVLKEITWLQQTGLRWSGMFAWPGGGVTLDLLNLLSRYYSLGRSSAVTPQMTPIADRPMDMRSLGIYSGYSGASVQASIDAAVANKTWLILRIHDIVASGASSQIQVNQADFNDLLSRVATAVSAGGAKVMAMGQVARAVAAGV
jgi:hypothetical protein